MAEARNQTLARWRAFLGLLRGAGGPRAATFAALVLLAGILPTGVILLTGALIRAVPGAVAHGLGAPGARPALLALGALVLALGALMLGSNALAQLARVLDSDFALEIHHAVARACLETPGLGPLEDPAFADRLQPIQDAERRGNLRAPVTSLAQMAMMRLRGIGAFVVLLGFAWWAPAVLAAAWWLTNRVYRTATEHGISVQMSDGAVGMRRAEYLRSLALDAPAAKEVRVFGLGDWLVGRYGSAWLGAMRTMWKARRARPALTAATVVALAASHAAVLYALGAAALDGALGVAALTVFVQAAIATSDLGLPDDWQFMLVQALAVAGRVAELRDALPPGAAALPPAPAAADRSAPPAAFPVAFEGVTFTYAGREVPTLDGLTLHVPAGQSLAVVGENGAGKTTLVKLLTGMYEPQAGRVTIGGETSPLQARGRVGVIFQDFVRYPLTLRENVGFGHLALLGDRQALEGALDDAGGAALAAEPGWEAVLSKEYEGGADLSGGQWQRVALARALAAVRGGAGLLILDEPTASLDVRAETELFERFLDLTRGITTILVSHRLSSVRRAERIVVIDGGRVVEDGTHDALMRRKGRYATMYALQAERFAAAPAANEPAAGEVA